LQSRNKKEQHLKERLKQANRIFCTFCAYIKIKQRKIVKEVDHKKIIKIPTDRIKLFNKFFKKYINLKKEKKL